MVGVVGGVVAVVVLLVLGSPGEAVGGVAIVAAAGVAAVVLYAGAELFWAWLQAPMRLLTTDVLAIRERLESLEVSPPAPTEPPFDMRYSRLNSIRLGKKLVERARNVGLTADAHERTPERVGNCSSGRRPSTSRWSPCSQGRSLSPRGVGAVVVGGR